MVNLKKFRGRRKTILIGDIDRDQDSMNYRLRPNCKYVELRRNPHSSAVTG